MKKSISIKVLVASCLFWTGAVFGGSTDGIGASFEQRDTTSKINYITGCTISNKSACKSPLFALKTNLLFDAATMLNIEFEIPFARRWSIAGEWIFPWWLSENKQHCLQLLSGNVEGRYWFRKSGDRNNQLLGWFTGLYAGGGLYDLEWNRKGYQGEFYIAAGVSGGFVHTINRTGNLRMEYSLGIGYLRTDYRNYNSRTIDNELVWQADGRYTWIGPTRAKVSLVWMMDWAKILKKEGGRR